MCVFHIKKKLCFGNYQRLMDITNVDKLDALLSNNVSSSYMAVFSALSSGSSKHPLLMHLLRCLHFLLAHFDISLTTSHIAGVYNTAAVTLSRNNLPCFFQCLPQVNQTRVPVPSIPRRHATASAPRLALHTLENYVSHFIGQALAPSTVQTYRCGQRRFSCFCRDAGLKPFPLTDRLLCLFVSHLAADGLTHQIIKSYLSAVWYFHITNGHGDPFSSRAFPLLQYVLRGIKWSPRPPLCTHLPITPSILKAMRSVWASRSSHGDHIMLWAAGCMGFFGLMRAGEFTLKSARDSNPPRVSLPRTWQWTSMLTLLCFASIQSKTDPYRHGVNIYIGRTDSSLCLVAAVVAYVAIRQVAPGPFFIFRDGSPLTRDKLVAAVREVLAEAGLDVSGYSGHSFRIGAATSALRQASAMLSSRHWAVGNQLPIRGTSVLPETLLLALPGCHSQLHGTYVYT